MSYSDHAATPQSSFGTLTLAGVLDDLAARFIVNLPPDELESMDRVCFQIEQAYAPPYSTRPGIWTGRGGGATGTSEGGSAACRAGGRAGAALRYSHGEVPCDQPAWAEHRDGRGRGSATSAPCHVGWDTQHSSPTREPRPEEYGAVIFNVVRQPIRPQPEGCRIDLVRGSETPPPRLLAHRSKAGEPPPDTD